MPSYTGVPDKHPEATTVDGLVKGTLSSGRTWSAIRTTGSAATDADATERCVWLTAHASTADKYTRLWRSILGFDTSSIPAGATINSVSLALRGTGKSITLFSSASSATDLCVTDCTAPATPTELVTADFTKPGSTVYGSVGYTSWSTSGTNTITLDTAAVTKGDITWLALQVRCDAENSQPTWASGGQNVEYSMRFSDYGSTQPTLTVTYTVSGTRRVMVIA